jgi:hypothetical protein
MKQYTIVTQTETRQLNRSLDSNNNAKRVKFDNQVVFYYYYYKPINIYKSGINYALGYVKRVSNIIKRIK